jgi:AcrR family transcriptional regulator
VLLDEVAADARHRGAEARAIRRRRNNDATLYPIQPCIGYTSGSSTVLLFISMPEGGGVSTELAHDRATAQPVSARRERTRERLLDAAYEVFAQQGVHGASIEAICEAAGFTRGAFYSNFESKEALFIALADRQVRARLAALERAVAGLDPTTLPRHHLDRDAIRSLLGAVMSDPGDERLWYLMTTEFELLALRDREVGARWVAQQQTLQGELAAVLPRLLGDLGLRFVIDARIAVDVLLSAYEAGVRESFFSGSADRPGTTLEVLADLLVAETS